MADAGGREPLGVAGGNVEAGGLLKACLGEQHPGCELPELGFGPGPEPGLGEDRRDEGGGVAGLAEGGVQREGFVVAVGAQGRKELPAFGGEQGCDLVLGCWGHAFQPS